MRPPRPQLALTGLVLALAAPSPGACPAPDPLLLTRSGADVELWWSADVQALGGYLVFRATDKADLPGLTAGAEHLSVAPALPPFPVLDLGAVQTPQGALYYQVHPRCSLPCRAGSDRDLDRLDDCVETATGTYVGPADAGTSPDAADTDLDGIDDGDEVLGTLAGLDLLALGASPVHKDIFLEYDWFEDDNNCAQHSHRPTQAMLDRVTAAFAAAPVLNPDGTTGIRTHHDRGQGAPFNGGNFIDDADGVLVGGVSSPEFKDYKIANSDPARLGYFHYVILPHRYNTTSGSSGQAELPGNDLIVSLQCSNSTGNVANTIVHELGHNLRLRHGGGENCNYKPNYNSVMNYEFQFAGADTDCDAGGDGLPDYSRGTNIDLDENNLDENLGVCGAPPINWDGNGGIEVGVVFNLNTGQDGVCGGALTVLTDHDDWAAADLSRVVDNDFAPVPPEIIDCDNPAPR